MKTKLNINIFYTFIFLLIVNVTQSQNNRFSKNVYTNTKGDSLNYRLLFPDYDTIRKYPLVIFLHGSGERGNDNTAQLKWGVTNFATDEAMVLHPAFVIAPQCPKNETWSNVENYPQGGAIKLKPTPSKSMTLLIELIHKFIKNYNVDTSRIYITGLSMGGYGTYDALERYPEMFAAAVPVCGAGDTSRAKDIAKIPMWIFHGSEDAAVNPNYSVEMYKALLKEGAMPGFTMYPETGHFSWLAAYSNKYMMSWLFKQHK